MQTKRNEYKQAYLKLKKKTWINENLFKNYFLFFTVYTCKAYCKIIVNPDIKYLGKLNYLFSNALV